MLVGALHCLLLPWEDAVYPIAVTILRLWTRTPAAAQWIQACAHKDHSSGNFHSRDIRVSALLLPALQQTTRGHRMMSRSPGLSPLLLSCVTVAHALSCLACMRQNRLTGARECRRQASSEPQRILVLLQGCRVAGIASRCKTSIGIPTQCCSLPLSPG